MRRPAVTWRLEGGYSRFLEGSHVEVTLGQNGLSQSLDLSPLGLARKREPVEILFRFSRSYRGDLGHGVRWTIGPGGRCRALLLFSGQAFLGNFKVPPNCFGIQWDVEAEADARLENEPGGCLLSLGAGTRFSQSWVRFFPETESIGSAIRQAWEQYRNPLDPADVFLLEEGQVIRWRWTGQVTLGARISWGIGHGWVIPSTDRFVELRKEILALAGAAASFSVKQGGEFSLQVRKSGGSVMLRLRREKRIETGESFSLGVQIEHPVHISRLGFAKPAPLRTVSRAISQPVIQEFNRVCEDALTRRLQIAFSLEHRSWKEENVLFVGTWKSLSSAEFASSYSRVLCGEIPDPEAKKVKVSGRLERVRGRQFSIRVHMLDWLKLGSARTRETKTVTTLGPGGEIVVEETDQFEKTDYRWDEVQLTRMLYNQGAEGEGSVVWTWGVEARFGRDEIRRWLRIPLHLRIIPEYELPPRTAFPLSARLMTATEFSPEALRQIREASADRRWEALVEALELSEPERYGRPTFWRDWIESEKLRALVERDPVSSELLTRYPVAGRSDPERTMVVMTYRRIRKFLHLMELWKRGDREPLMRATGLDMGVPVIVYFHLLSEPALRRSAALLTGDVQRTWGEEDLLEG